MCRIDPIWPKEPDNTWKSPSVLYFRTIDRSKEVKPLNDRASSNPIKIEQLNHLIHKKHASTRVGRAKIRFKENENLDRVSRSLKCLKRVERTAYATTTVEQRASTLGLHACTETK